MEDDRAALLDAALARICAFEPSERPQSFEELLEDLGDLADLLAISEAVCCDVGSCPGYYRRGLVGGLSDEPCEKSSDFTDDDSAVPAVLQKQSYVCACPPPLVSPKAVVDLGDGVPDDPMEERTPIRIDRVSFSIVSPRAVERDEYATIDMVMYEREYRDVVDQLKEEAFSQVQERRSGTMEVGERASVRVVLRSDAVSVEDGEQEMTWLGGFLSFSFNVLVPRDYVRNTIPFVAMVYVNDVIASRLSFVVRCAGERGQRPDVKRTDFHSAFVFRVRTSSTAFPASAPHSSRPSTTTQSVSWPPSTAR